MPSSRWDKQPPYELRGDLCARLPYELVVQVLLFGAHADRDLAISLLRVSSWTHDLVEPLFYRTLHLRSKNVSAILRSLSTLPPRYLVDNPVGTLVADYGIMPGNTFQAHCAHVHTLVVHISLLPHLRVGLVPPDVHWMRDFKPRTLVVFGNTSGIDMLWWASPSFARLEYLVCAEQFPDFVNQPCPASLKHLVVPMQLLTPEYIRNLHEQRPDVHVTVYERVTDTTTRLFLDPERIFPTLPNVTQASWALDLTAFDPWNPLSPLAALFE